MLKTPNMLENEIEELQAKIKLKAGQKAKIHQKQREAAEKAKRDEAEKRRMEVKKEISRLQYYKDLISSRGVKMSAFGSGMTSGSLRIDGERGEIERTPVVFPGDGSSARLVNQLLGIVDCLKEDIDALEKRIKKLEGKK